MGEKPLASSSRQFFLTTKYQLPARKETSGIEFHSKIDFDMVEPIFTLYTRTSGSETLMVTTSVLVLAWELKMTTLEGEAECSM